MDINFIVLNSKIKRQWEGIFPKKCEVLDIGCGDNPQYHRFIGGPVVCADKLPSHFAHVQCDAQALPFKGSSFDGVVSVNALYYCENPFGAVQEFHRVLKKRGTLVMITPFVYPIHDVPHDRYRFTEFGLKGMLDEKFVIEKIVPIGGLPSLPSLLLHSIHKGAVACVPKKLKQVMHMLMVCILLPFSIIALLCSLLDAADKSKRFPIYYFTVARKK